jgi:hypothetical protein
MLYIRTYQLNLPMVGISGLQDVVGGNTPHETRKRHTEAGLQTKTKKRGDICLASHIG